MPVFATWLRTLSAKLGRMIPAIVADAPIKNWRHEIEITCLLFSGFSNMLGAQLRWNLPNPLGGSARYRISYSNYDFPRLCPCLLCGRSRSCRWSARYCFASTVAHNSTLRPALNFSCVTGFILLLRGKLLTVLSLQPQPPSSPSSRSGVAGSGAN